MSVTEIKNTNASEAVVDEQEIVKTVTEDAAIERSEITTAKGEMPTEKQTRVDSPEMIEAVAELRETNAHHVKATEKIYTVVKKHDEEISKIIKEQQSDKERLNNLSEQNQLLSERSSENSQKIEEVRRTLEDEQKRRKDEIKKLTITVDNDINALKEKIKKLESVSRSKSIWIATLCAIILALSAVLVHLLINS